jgi:hypothetical protein
MTRRCHRDAVVLAFFAIGYRSGGAADDAGDAVKICRNLEVRRIDRLRDSLIGVIDQRGMTAVTFLEGRSLL